MQIFDTHIHAIKTGLKNLSLPQNPENLYDPLRYTLSMNGKHIRPLLTFLAADLFGLRETEKILPAALAIECFHNFTLLHDDIMDSAELRRGQLPVYKKWNSNIAILSGDVLMIKAYEQLAKSPTAHIPDLLKVMNRIAIEVCEGQQYDMDFEDRESITVTEYLDMIRLKTSVLLGGTLEMGAILAEAEPKDQHLIRDFGTSLGLAFQLQDDILDTYGESASVGKQIGGDIIENKKTILLAHLLNHISEVDKPRLTTLLHHEKEEKTKIKEVKNLYEKYGALEKATDLKIKFTQRALKQLESIRAEEENKDALRKIVNNLLNRQS